MRSSLRNQRVFGITAPSKMQENAPDAKTHTSGSNICSLKEYNFIFETVSRFSIKGTKEYLKTCNEGILIAHLKRQISKEKEKLEALQKEKQLINCKALFEELSKLKETRSDLEKKNSELKAAYANVNSLFSRICTECDETVISKERFDSVQFEEEYERQLSLLKTQNEALKQREQRELVYGMNQTLLQQLKKKIEETKDEMDKIEQQKKEKDDRYRKYIYELSVQRVEYQNKLIRKYNADYKDVSYPIKDIIEWIKVNDPVIIGDEYEVDKKKRNMPKSVYKLLDEPLPPVENVFDKVPKFTVPELNI